MACCTEYQTECLKVVNIGYLKKFIGKYIQKSDGNTYVISTTKDDSYCPTYTELTNGSLVPYWSEETNPINDTDGVVVNRVASGTGANYGGTQLVNQSDLSVRYTRVSGLTISAAKTSGFDGCKSGETSISYTIGYTRYTTSMNGCTTNKKTTSTGKTVNNDCASLTPHTSFSDVTATCTSYKIGTNPTEEERCDNFFLGISFRNSEFPSNTVVICQDGSTGSYSEEKPNSTREEKVRLEVIPSPRGLVVKSCDNVSKNISLVGTLVYNEYKTFYWVDCNGNVDRTREQERMTGSEKEKSAGSTSSTISNTSGCCSGTSTATKVLTLTYSGLSESRTFSAICEGCEDDPSCSSGGVCCKIIGPGTVGCQTTTPLSYRVGDCGEPEYCKAVIVDGGVHPGTLEEEDLPATGSSPSYDSSYVDESSKFVIEVYDGVPASWMPTQGSMTPPPAGITPQVYSSDTTVSDLRFSWAGPSSSEKIIETVENPYSDYGWTKQDYFNHSRCVAARLQWEYLGSDPATRPPCMDVEGCNFKYYTDNCSSPGSYPGDLCCNQDYDHTPEMMKNLTSLGYKLGQNNSGKRRVIYIYWVPADAVTYKDCPSAVNIIRQAG
jgi:hypothetical protein